MGRSRRVRHCVLAALLLVCHSPSLAEGPLYSTTPPFGIDLLTPVKGVGDSPAENAPVFAPRNPFTIFVNSDSGMHAVGFDMSYLCIVPPFASIQAQAVKSGSVWGPPRLLSPEDEVQLGYSIVDNSYSEGNKMQFWQVFKDLIGDGAMSRPNNNMANYVWDHLFIYQDFQGGLPESPQEAQRLHLGLDIPINVDSGFSGKSLAGGVLDHAGVTGNNILFTDSMIPGLTDLPLTFTPSHLWDAVGLPLTAFPDTRRRGSSRSIAGGDFQNQQTAVVQLRDSKGNPILVEERPVQFAGVVRVGVFDCVSCHSGSGKAAVLSRERQLLLMDTEYAYWKDGYPDATEHAARLKAAMINILQLHDHRHQTEFLREYASDASSNRLGSVGSVNCADCHGDNVSGNFQSPRRDATGYRSVRSKPLTEAIHSLHARAVPLPDKAGRPRNCLSCHSPRGLAGEGRALHTLPDRLVDEQGNPRFPDGDARVPGRSGGLKRDAHWNPGGTPPFFLNSIGKWLLSNVSRKDEAGDDTVKSRGLYCTNCHNSLAHALYEHDDLTDGVMQAGKTLRRSPIQEVISVLAGGDTRKFRSFFADPTVGAPGDPFQAYYGKPRKTVLMRVLRPRGGGLAPLPWNAVKGELVSYAAASGGSDWWLAPSEPHCADCHLAPFVESPGGPYFPLDQPNKYALFRHSKAHGILACQTCHQSMHSLYARRRPGSPGSADSWMRDQAFQFSPDGKYAGPVTCATCHTVNSAGVPVQLKGTEYSDDYWASVVLIHFMRDGDQALSAQGIVGKYPYRLSSQIVQNGWE